jgi:DNA-binding MarR family transcriptional regulator
MAKKQSPPLGRDECVAMYRLCVSTSLRRTERLVTRHYDSHLAASGVTAVQLPILAAIGGAAEPTFRMLAEQLELDRSTLSRNLALLERRGLLVIGPSSGPKPGMLSLTPEGNDTLIRAHKLWVEAHRSLERAVSGAGLTQGLRFLKRLRSAAREADGRTS